MLQICLFPTPHLWYRKYITQSLLLCIVSRSFFNQYSIKLSIYLFGRSNRNATTYISVTYYIRYLGTLCSNFISSYKRKRIKNFKTAVNSISPFNTVLLGILTFEACWKSRLACITTYKLYNISFLKGLNFWNVFRSCS